MKKRNFFVFLVCFMFIIFALSGCNKNRINVTLKDGNTVLTTFDIEEGENIESKIQNLSPTKDGYSFIGWETEDGKSYVLDSAVYQDLVLVAKFEEETCFINIKKYDGNTNKSIEVGTNHTYTVPANPTKSGYSFGGYYYINEDGDEVTFTLNGSYTGKSINIYCKWNKLTDWADYDVEDDVNQQQLYFTEGDVIVIGTGIEYEFTSTIESVTSECANVKSTHKIKFNEAGTATLKLKNADDLEKTISVKIVKTISNITYGASYLSSWGSNVNLGATFLAQSADFNKAKDAYSVGVSNFKADIVINAGAIENLNSDDFIVLVNNETGKATIDSNGVITFDSSLVGKTKTVTIKPKYNFVGNNAVVTFQNVKFNDGVNVYTNSDMFNAYKDLDNQEINVLRNIKAELTYWKKKVDNGDGTYTYYPIDNDRGTYLSLSGVYVRQACDVDDNLVINGNYFEIDASDIRDYFDYIDTSTVYEMSVVHAAVFHYLSLTNPTCDKPIYGNYPLEGDEDIVRALSGTSNVDSQFTMNNLEIYSGLDFSQIGALSSDVQSSNKPRLLNSDYCNGIYMFGGTLNLNNCSLHGLTIGLFTQAMSGDGNKNGVIINSECSKIEKNFTSSIISFGYNDICLKNSSLGYSSGPLILYNLYAGGPSTKLGVDSYTSEHFNNWIIGSEAWFAAYGQTSLAGNLKTTINDGVSALGLTSTKGNKPVDYVNLIMFAQSDTSASNWGSSYPHVEIYCSDNAQALDTDNAQALDNKVFLYQGGVYMDANLAPEFINFNNGATDSTRMEGIVSLLDANTIYVGDDTDKTNVNLNYGSGMQYEYYKLEDGVNAYTSTNSSDKVLGLVTTGTRYVVCALTPATQQSLGTNYVVIDEATFNQLASGVYEEVLKSMLS